MPITASMLYDLDACPHRVTRDLFDNPKDRDAVSPFVQLLWERGMAHERAVISALKLPFVDLSKLGGEEKERATREAMQRGEARAIVGGEKSTTPAYSSGVCKNCVWYSTCVKALEKTDDLTLIPFLGRSMRDTLNARIGTIRDLAEINPDGFLTDKGKKTVFPRIGPDTLRKMSVRAKLIADKGKPFLTAPIILPALERELFFDIEVDPMRDVCYLHGFVEREGYDNATERFVSFFVDDPDPAYEERAFADAMTFLRGKKPCVIYYYSKYERTIYRKLQAKYPDVCSAADIEELFDPQAAIDLYFDVVLKATEWPTRDYSIKSLAQYLGFEWRDPHPSGAASIEWFDRWVRERDPAVRKRVLEYNEDDCRATRVLVDGIRELL